MHTYAAGSESAAQKKDKTLTQTTKAAGNNSARKAPAKSARRKGANDALLKIILTSLEKDNAEDVVSISLSGKSQIADHMVICSGRSTRQVASIAEKLSDTLKQDQGIISRLEGKDQGDWVLIDAGDVIVHVFRPEVREFYQLEKLWMDPGGASPAQ